MKKTYDAIVIGGGLYGCCLALFLRNTFQDVLVIEKESKLNTRASYINQARVHNGYHYPRSFITALRSRINFPRFVSDFRECIDDDFEKIYAIARKNSKVNARQFQAFCERIGAPIKKAAAHIQKLFNKQYIEEVFSVKEYAFDAEKLGKMLERWLTEANIEVYYNAEVEKVAELTGGGIIVVMKNNEELVGKRVFNCTYAEINTILERSGFPRLPFKHEITEMALIEVPDQLKKVGITVMDGPFFSVMPFPARHLYSLTHVRYTPHQSWSDETSYRDAYAYLERTSLRSNYPFMIKDAERYIPILKEAKYRESLYELKALLMQNEVDDGRPILFRKDYGIKNFSIIMGGKIDNIYDIIEKLEEYPEYMAQEGKVSKKWWPR